MDPNQIMSIVGAYNADPRSFTDEEAEMVAMLASQTGMKFRRENKPIQKGLFNMADIGLLGMLPNEWEPYSRGQSVYGESFSEKVGSGMGAAAGLPLALLSGSALVRGGMGLAKGAWGMMRGARGVAGGGGAAGGGAAGAPYAGGGNLLTAGRGGGGMLELTAGRGGGNLLSAARSRGASPTDFTQGFPSYNRWEPTMIPPYAQSRYNTVQQGFQRANWPLR